MHNWSVIVQLKKQKKKVMWVKLLLLLCQCERKMYSGLTKNLIKFRFSAK